MPTPDSTYLYTCSLCGTLVRVAGGEDAPGDGGTRYYVPVTEDLKAALREIGELATVRQREAPRRDVSAAYVLLIDTLCEIATKARRAEAAAGTGERDG